MNKQIFTGNYYECEAGNLISISKDKGRSANFNGKAILELAPKKEFWRIWKDNIGKIPEIENTKYYITEYYNQVLSKIDIEKLLENETKPILLCYETGNQFCHRHVVAEYIEFLYGVKVKDIKINKNFVITENKRPEYIKEILFEVMSKSNYTLKEWLLYDD